ncbi:MAG: transposase [bacterium]|nr:transposase [bacterium]
MRTKIGFKGVMMGGEFALRLIKIDGFQLLNAAKEVFGEGIIIIDRFHVAQLYRGAVDTLRKKELKRLKRELPEEEYKKLKGVMWMLRKSPRSYTMKNERR